MSEHAPHDNIPHWYSEFPFPLAQLHDAPADFLISPGLIARGKLVLHPSESDHTHALEAHIAYSGGSGAIDVHLDFWLSDSEVANMVGHLRDGRHWFEIPITTRHYLQSLPTDRTAYISPGVC